MAQQKRRTPVQQKQRSWTIPKLLLLVGYGLVLVFLGIVFMMRQELLRVGIFGNKQAIHAPVPVPASQPQVTTESQRSASSPPPPAHHPGEITADEKQALEDILRSKH